MLFSLLLACDSPALSEAPAASSAPVAPADPAPLAADPARYGETWLVVVNSSRTPGELPESWDALVAISRDGARPERLRSSEFKGLMPCYEIIVAAGIPDLAGARLLSEGLRVSGVDNYIKNAGTYVGPDPRIDEACQGPASVSTDAVSIAASRAGALYLPLSLPDAVAERAMESAGAQAMLGDATTWSAPLTVQTIGDVSLGAAYSVIDLAGEVQTCQVDGFVVLTDGEPHFGYYQEGDQSAPGCGQPRIHARLSCDAPDAALVVADGAPLPALLPITEPESAPLPEAARAHDSFQSLHRTLTGQAAERGAPLVEVSSAVGVSDSLRYLQVRLMTGEGNNLCGGEDLNTTLYAVMDVQGGLVMPFVDMDWTRPVAVIQQGETFSWLSQDWTGSWELREAGGEILSQWYREYCDCGC
jgi:hypothetical protein